MKIPPYRWEPLQGDLMRAVIKRDFPNGESVSCFNCGSIEGSSRLHEVKGHHPWSYYKTHLEELKICCDSCNPKIRIPPGHQLTPACAPDAVDGQVSAGGDGGSGKSRMEIAGLPLDFFPNPTVLAHQLLQYRHAGFAARANRIYEVPWLEFVIDYCHEKGLMRWDNAVNGGSAKVGCNPSTALRYANKHSDPTGPGPLEKVEDDINGEALLKLRKPILDYFAEQKEKTKKQAEAAQASQTTQGGASQGDGET